MTSWEQAANKNVARVCAPYFSGTHISQCDTEAVSKNAMESSVVVSAMVRLCIIYECRSPFIIK